MKSIINKKTVLVTGSNSQLARTIKKYHSTSAEIKFIFKSKNELDITQHKLVANFFESYSLDYVINCAAYTNVEEAELESETADEVNYLAVKNLASLCSNFKTRLIHISTDYVFDGITNELYTESHEPNPINTYGISKLKGELAIQKILVEHYIIRTSWLYANFGKNFLNTMLDLVKEKKQIKVVIDQLGSPTSAISLAEAIIKIISKSDTLFGTYHFCNNGVTSWYNFAEKIFSLVNKPIELQESTSSEFGAKAKRPPFSGLSTLKISQELNIDIPKWEESLAFCLSERTNIE